MRTVRVEIGRSSLEVFQHSLENMGTSTKCSVEVQASFDELSLLF